MTALRSAIRSWHALSQPIGELLLIIFGPLIVTFLIVYYFPDQYRWLVETTQPFSMLVVSNMLRLVDMLPFIATGDDVRSAHAMEVAFSGDNLFGCYIGVLVGSVLSSYIGWRKRLTRRLVDEGQ